MAWAAAIPAAIQIGTSIYDRMNQKDPTGKAGDYLNEAQGAMPQYYQPWIDSGKRAIPTLEQQYNQNINNPGQQLARIGQDYQQSPGYQFGYDKGMQTVNNAAAAGGMLGTPAHEEDAARFATGYQNQDFNNYLQNALSMYNTGLNGLQTQSGQGLTASTNLAQAIKDILESKAKLEYEGAQGSNKSDSNMFGGIGGALGGMDWSNIF